MSMSSGTSGRCVSVVHSTRAPLMLEPVAHGVAAEAGEDRDEDRTGLQRAEHDRQRLRDARHQPRHPVALPDPEPGEQIGEARALLRRFAKAHAPYFTALADPDQGGAAAVRAVRVPIDDGRRKIDRRPPGPPELVRHVVPAKRIQRFAVGRQVAAHLTSPRPTTSNGWRSGRCDGRRAAAAPRRRASCTENRTMAAALRGFGSTASTVKRARTRSPTKAGRRNLASWATKAIIEASSRCDIAVAPSAVSAISRSPWRPDA